jgi:hypothetical protein
MNPHWLRVIFCMLVLFWFLKCVSLDFIRGHTRSDAVYGKKILKNVSIL